MKKKLCALILAMACVCSLGTTGASAAGMDEQEGYSTTVISGEDAIQAYLEEVGEPYDPNLVEVIRVEYERNIENRDGRKRLYKVKLWETIIQSPYSVEFAESVVRKQIEDEMFPEGKEWLIAKIGITGKYNGSYEKMREAMEQNPEDSFYSGNVVIARQQRLKRNFRSKYWEVAIVHTKPLGDVPEDLMPEVKKPVQGT